MTDHGLHLREVQRAKKMYGLMHRQFTLYYKTALRKGGNTGDNLVQLLEQRLDNVVFRSNLANSRDHARQMVLHGHFHINGKKVRIPSYRVQAGDTLEANPREKSRKIVKEAHDNRKDKEIPSWLKLDEEPLKGTVVNVPSAADIATPLETQLIVEYMSR
jgi:small subunit ribosomal protein S4